MSVKNKINDNIYPKSKSKEKNNNIITKNSNNSNNTFNSRNDVKTVIELQGTNSVNSVQAIVKIKEVNSVNSIIDNKSVKSAKSGSEGVKSVINPINEVKETIKETNTDKDEDDGEEEYEEEGEEEEEEYEEDDDIIDFEDFRNSPKKSIKGSPKRNSNSPKRKSKSPIKKDGKLSGTEESEKNNYEDNVVNTYYPSEGKNDDITQDQEKDLIKKLIINKNSEKKNQKNPKKKSTSTKKDLKNSIDMDTDHYNNSNTVDKTDNKKNNTSNLSDKKYHNNNRDISRYSTYNNEYIQKMTDINRNDYSNTKIIENSQMLHEIKSETDFPDRKFSDLLELNIQDLDKEEIVHILMSNEYIKSPEKKASEYIKPKKARRYSQDHINKLAYIKSYTVDANNIDFLDNFKDPEYNNDFKIASKKVADKICKDADASEQISAQNELMKLLFSDRKDKQDGFSDISKIGSDISKIYEAKTKDWIEKKNRNLEIVSERMQSEFKKIHTFSPQSHSKYASEMESRNFEEWLDDQITREKKVKDKISIKKQEIDKENALKHKTKPEINEISKKIVAELAQESEEVRLAKIMKKKQRGKPESVKKKKKHIKEVMEHTNFLYKDFGKKKERIQKLGKKLDEIEEKKVFHLKSSSKKFVLRNFVKQFKTEITNIFEEIKDTTTKKLNLVQLVTFFKNMRLIVDNDMVDYVDNNLGSDNETTQKDLLSISASVNLNQSTIKRKEKRLIIKVYDALKNAEGLISIENLFLFLLSLLKLYDYYLVKSYKKKNPKNNKANDIIVNQVLNTNPLSMKESTTNILKKDILDEEKQKQLDELIAKNIREHLSKKVKVVKKYCGFDDNNNIIITFEQAKLINIDFNQFYMNWSNYDGSSKLNNKQNNKKILEEKNVLDEKRFPFKPVITEKSQKLYSEYRAKIRRELEISKREDNSNNMSKFNPNSTLMNKSNIKPLSPKHTETLEYVNLMIKKRLVQDKINEKTRIANSKKEEALCTFKPKLNKTKMYENKSVINNDNNPAIMTTQQRLEMMYNKGKIELLKKTNKKKDEVDFENLSAEYTFKPILNEKDYERLYERRKLGRIEKEIRDTLNIRSFELRSPEKMYQEILNEKRVNDMSRKIQKEEKKLREEHKNDNIKNNMDNNNINVIKDDETNINPNNPNSPTNQANQSPKKDVIPLLIIDVTIKPGDKKKIHICEGDTAEELAERFSQENELDEPTQNKLKVLIQGHMSKLLTSIKESKEEDISMKSSKKSSV